MKIGRNSPCACGSQIKAKRCCMAAPGLRVNTPRAVLARLQPSVAADLAGVDRAGFRSLYDEMIYLPERNMALHMRLPALHTPDIARAADAIHSGDTDRFDTALRDARAAIDTPERRLELAQALIALRDSGEISPALTAVAIIDLNQPDSAFVTSSLAEAIAVTTGDEPTPAGLLVAAR